jgi:hypothetical protein
MEAIDIQKIEKILKIKLPQDYKNILLNYPPEIAEAGELQFSNDAEWLIGQNEFVREDPANFFGKKAWPGEYFVIGEDGNGNCYYLDLSQKPPSTVFLLSHDEPDRPGRSMASSLETWLPILKNELAEARKNSELLAKNLERVKKSKPWWKFW